MTSVRQLIDKDIDAILHINTASNPYPWSENSLKECLKNDIVFVAYDENSIQAFAIFYDAYDCLELLLIVTDQSYRQQGIAKTLLLHGLEYGVSKDFEQCVLEVRESNLPAQQLYAQLGFMPSGIRKNYYPLESGHEHALLFSRPFVR